MTSSGSQGISSNESMGLRLNGFLCRPGGGPCRHPQIGISELRCGALRPSALSATASDENTPLFLFARPVKSAGLIVSLLLNRPAPLPSEPWQPAHFDRNSIRPFSISCAQTQVFVDVTMQAKNTLSPESRLHRNLHSTIITADGRSAPNFVVAAATRSTSFHNQIIARGPCMKLPARRAVRIA